MAALLPGGRLHLHHGPIDIVCEAFGPPASVRAGYGRAAARFATILEELVAELPALRSEDASVGGRVARRMACAVALFRPAFITPMAAVAGAVADEMIGCFREDPRIARAYVNNGGDIALHLAPGQQFKVGLFADLARVKWREQLGLDGDFALTADLPVRGIATSGWRGRSFSLGIADSATVLARTAAEADAAATMVANSVNVDDPAILRKLACELKDDTDLGARLVTVGVGILSVGKVEQALAAGEAHAQRLVDAGTIHGAVLCLQGCVRVVGGATEAGLEPLRPSAPLR
jgi:ApbE superfamily uncharacterized protein (UPF0280 family)